MPIITTPRLGLEVPDGDELDDVPTWMLSLATQLDGMVGPADHGLRADRPVSTIGTPGIADRTYFATDVDPATITDPATDGQFYRDNGTGWDAIGPYVSKMKVGTMAPASATGNQDVLGLGFKPKLVRFLFNANDNSDANCTFAEGRADASSQFVMFCRAQTGTFQRRTLNSRVLHWLNNDTTVAWSAAFVSFLADGFRLNWLNAAGSPGGFTIAWEAWG